MKRTSRSFRRGCFYGTAGLCALIGMAFPTGCSKPTGPAATNDDAPKSATTTTAAKGVMHPGSRSHKNRVKP